MAEAAVDAEPAQIRPASMATVVAASTAGTAFEWYDFFIFGNLVQVISRNFFAQLGPTAGLIASLALFGVGFAFRPLGALVFGRLGDQIGRKAAFLTCVLMMGGATFLIGALPTSAQAGAIAPILLILLRVLQGAAVGGQYGGAAIFVAEHAPADRRGYFTGWVQTSAAFGLTAALAVIFVTRRSLGEEAFAAWGWRLPFFASAVLVAASIWMRLRLTESPAFQQLKAEGGASAAPYAEAFGRWSNLKLVLIAFLGIMCAQGAYWYTVFFYADVFMEKFLKVEGDYANLVIMIGALVSAPSYVFFGWLSDRVGRKLVMWGGMTLGLVALFPAFMVISQAANPALTHAARTTPVVVVADPADCSLHASLHDNAPSYNITFTYHVTDDVMVYVAHRRGYRAGFLSARATSFENMVNLPETLQDVEGGFKSQFSIAGMPARFNGAGYYSWYSNIAVTIPRTDPVTGLPVNEAENSGAAHLYGAEESFDIRPVEGLEINESYAYTYAAYDNFPSQTVSDALGNPLIFYSNANLQFGFPRHQFNIGATYQLPLDESVGTLTLAVNYSYTSSRPDGLAIDKGFDTLPAYGLVNLRLDWRDIMHSGLDLALWGNNVTNEHYLTSTFAFEDAAGFRSGFPGDPATFGATLTYRFGSGSIVLGPGFRSAL